MQFVRTAILGIAAMLAVSIPGFAQSAKANDVVKVAIQVSDNDAKTMNLALNNVENMVAAYKKMGKKVDVHVVTYGPGLTMFREDKSPVKARIQHISIANPSVTFAACGVTLGKAEKKENKQIKIVSEAKMVPSGIVHLVELQRKGYAYIKP